MRGHALIKLRAEMDLCFSTITKGGLSSFRSLSTFTYKTLTLCGFMHNWIRKQFHRLSIERSINIVSYTKGIVYYRPNAGFVGQTKRTRDYRGILESPRHDPPVRHSHSLTQTHIYGLQRSSRTAERHTRVIKGSRLWFEDSVIVGFVYLDEVR